MADLVLTLNVITKGHDETAGHLKGIGDAIGGLVSGLGAIGLAGMGLGTLGNAFQSLAADAIESQRVSAATAAVLQSTGGIAGMTAESVSGLATALSKVTPFEDEAIQSTENLLLTFTSIGKDVFPQVTEAALDMATAMGTDPKEAAIQLGKAMQDPITGATALRRVGVALSDQQQEAIKHFMAVGDVAGAQGVILKELQTEFGGAAKAAGQTFGGQMTILQTQIGNLKEAAFTPLLGVVGKLATSLTDFVSSDTFVDWITQASALLGTGLTRIFDLFGAEVEIVRAVVVAFTDDAGAMGIVYDIIRRVFGDGVADFLQPFLQWFMEAIPGIQTFVDDVVSYFQAFADDISKILNGDVLGGFEDLLTHLAEYEVFIAQHLLQWGKEFVAWIAPMVPPMLEALGGLLADLGAWLLDPALPTIVEHLLEWGTAFVKWVAPYIPPLLLELGKLLIEVGAWLLDPALPTIIKKLGEWGVAFVAWVGPQIPPLLEELGKVLKAVVDWILDPALPGIVGQLAFWAGAFVSWVADVVSKMPDALAKILAAITSWVTGDGLTGASSEAGRLGEGFLQGIIGAVTDGIPNLIKNLGDAVGGALSKVASAATAGFAAGLGGGGGGGGASAPSAGGGFSPFDAVFARYAGDLASNPEFIKVVAAGTKAESGWNPSNRTGDSGHSWGLFQLNDLGQGAGMGNARLDPDAASAVMVPLYAAAFRRFTAQGLTGEARAAATAQAAERSADPTGAAYAAAYRQIGAAATTTHDAIIGLQGSLLDTEQTISDIPDSFRPLDQSLVDMGLDVRSLSDTSVQSFSTVADAARSLSDQFGISVGQATNLVKDHGSVARTVLGEAVPGAFTVTDRAVERFADAFKINWDQARAVLEAGGATSELVMGTTIPASADLTNVALVAATAGADGLTASLHAIPTSITTTVNTIFNTGGPGSSAGVGSQSRYSTQTGGPGLYVLPDIVHGGSQTVQANSLGDAVLQAAIQSGVKASAQAAGGTFGTNTSPTLFAEGGPVLGPTGAPVSAIVHGGEYVLPAGSWGGGGGGDIAGALRQLAAALANQPIIVQIDGQVLGRATRTDSSRWNQAQGGLSAGVGGL